MTRTHIALAVPLALVCLGQARAGDVSLPVGAYRLTLAERDGALSLVGPGGEAVLGTGAESLWTARFADGHTLTARGLLEAGGTLTVEGTRLIYSGAELAVTVEVTPAAEWVDLRATVAPRAGDVVGLDLPSRLRFAAEQVVRFVSPANGNESVGTLFHRAFFEEQPAESPVGWAPGDVSGPRGYISLLGAGLTERPVDDPSTPALVTDTGREWLGPDLAARFEGTSVTANRPPAPGQADLVLVDSANGPWLSASRAGGTGLLLRLGGIVREPEAPLAVAAITRCLERVATGTGPRIAVLVVPSSPERGSWCDVRVRAWAEALRASSVLRRAGAEVTEVASPAELLASLADPARRPAAVINPYGEGMPLSPGVTMDQAVAAIGAYVRSGGCWVEVGGYPFFYALRPLRNLSYETGYPAGFADFQFLETTAGSAAVYRVAPREWEPWAALEDPAQVFVPGGLGCGRDDAGAYAQRSYTPYVRAGERWLSPTVRIEPGRAPEESLRRYASENHLTRPLADKLPPGSLDAFRAGVLFYYHGTAREALADLPTLPSPLLFHTAGYLKGGFDKEYPDHLPPNPGYGTMEELRQLADACRERGVLFMPYTNPTWWCDHPRGPTFLASGDAPLARDLAGQPYYEKYGTNDGWKITFWRPEVREANERTVRQFTEEIPVGVLFQDQCGARGSVPDANEGAPRPDAYTEGLLSMVQEDSRRVPLSTEGGWDRILPYEAQFCGQSWALVPPTHAAMSGLPLYRDRFPAGTWEPYPLAEYLGHESVSMLHHDLGQFVMCPETLAWTLGLGFGLSYVSSSGNLRSEPARDWLAWLATLQRAVCARYTGVALDEFSVLRDDPADLSDIALLASRYGEVSLVANTSDVARAVPGEEGVRLAPFGFHASAPGVEAGGLASLPGIAEAPAAGYWFTREEQPDGTLLLTLLAPQDAETAAPLPEGWSAARVLEPQAGLTAEVATGGRALRVHTPHRAGEAPLDPPEELRGLAQRDWPGDRRSTRVGVLDLAGLSPNWITFGPAEWLADLGASPALRDAGLTVEPVRTPAELREALGEGPARCFAIVNPYGEQLPCAEGLDASAMLGRLRQYVREGGVWWEVAGYSLYGARTLAADGTWSTASFGPSGLGQLGIELAGDPVDAPPALLRATDLGRELLSPATLQLVENLAAPANRAVARGAGTAHETLVASDDRDYVAGYRLGGWGWLWRIGGFNPPRELVTPLVADALAGLYARPPLPRAADPTPYLWQVRVRR